MNTLLMTDFELGGLLRHNEDPPLRARPRAQGSGLVEEIPSEPEAGARDADLEGAAAVLSRTELALLTAMVRQPTRWVSAQELIETAIGTHHRRETSLVRVHVHNMRRKLGPLSVIIESRRGCGYRYVPQSVESSDAPGSDRAA